MFKKLKKFFTEQSSSPTNGFFLKARCGKCGEEFNLFIDKSTALAQEFDEKGNTSYFLKKEILGSQCPNRMQVRMEFDSNKKFLSRSIENGEFLDE